VSAAYRVLSTEFGTRGDDTRSSNCRTWSPYPHAKKTLGVSHERGINLTPASSANEDEVQYYVHLLGIKKLLEGSTSKKDAKFTKPSPEIFQCIDDINGWFSS
jgi:phosphoglycolate phosphatase-like HAD superfamily hydrolase